jgi:two-component system sensor histidine kinase ChvG
MHHGWMPNLARDDIEPFDLGELLNALTRIANELLAGDGPEIVLDLRRTRRASGRWSSMAMSTGMGQVINNLIDNAKSFSPPDGVIRLAASP